MAYRRWQLEVEGRTRIVELEHGFFSGKRLIKLDDEVVVDIPSVTSFAMLGFNAIVASAVVAIHLYLIGSLIARKPTEEDSVASPAS